MLATTLAVADKRNSRRGLPRGDCGGAAAEEGRRAGLLVSEATAGRYVMKARERGFLGLTSPGKKGESVLPNPLSSRMTGMSEVRPHLKQISNGPDQPRLTQT